MGKLIVIEGAADGIGKSTQYKLLIENLESDGYKVYSHHFPSYNTYQGKPAEEYLSGSFGDPKDLSPYFINNLYALDRAITWKNTLEKYYSEDNAVILLDRYTTSSLIYQSALIDSEEEKKEFINYTIDYEYNKLGIKKPDAVIFLNAPFDVITNLRNKRTANDGVSNDIHESNLEFMKKVYDNSQLVSDHLDFINIDCSLNNNMLSIDEIQCKIYNYVKSVLK